MSCAKTASRAERIGLDGFDSETSYYSVDRISDLLRFVSMGRRGLKMICCLLSFNINLVINCSLSAILLLKTGATMVTINPTPSQCSDQSQKSTDENRCAESNIVLADLPGRNQIQV